MNERRVVVTGTGIVSCVGNNTNDFWHSVVNGRCGLGTVTHFDPARYRTQIAGQVKNFSITSYMPEKEARRLDPFCHFAVAAADEAISNAGISKNLENLSPERVGVVVSSGIGGIKTFEDQCHLLHERGPERISPLLIPMLIIDMASGAISMRYGAKGPNFGVVSACATACHSIGESYWIVKRDDADVMICGGAESPIVPIGFAGFCSMKAMSQRNNDPLHASRPFDRDRDGFVMSEGAGVLVLEELEHAKRRGANILAEIVGYGATADAYHITSPSPGGTGAALAINNALQKAGMNPEDIDYFNAHGTSTELNDKFETQAIKKVFGDYAGKLSISSTKSVTGHGLGAAGGFETIACILAMRDGIVPPTINLENPDPECDLNYTPNTAQEKKMSTAINVNLGFGGHNAVVILKKFE